MPTTLNPKKKVDPNLLASQQFAAVFQAYLECSDEVQTMIRDMVAIVNDPEADEDEISAAYITIGEALFPACVNGMLGVDLEEYEKIKSHPKETRDVLADMDREEATFADRVSGILDSKGMTQGDLAALIGVGQPAVSMMLNRACRPQRRTVEKIADALKVPPDELWPSDKATD